MLCFLCLCAYAPWCWGGECCVLTRGLSGRLVWCIFPPKSLTQLAIDIVPFVGYWCVEFCVLTLGLHGLFVC